MSIFVRFFEPNQFMYFSSLCLVIREPRSGSSSLKLAGQLWKDHGLMKGVKRVSVLIQIRRP